MVLRGGLGIGRRRKRSGIRFENQIRSGNQMGLVRRLFGGMGVGL